MLVATANLLLPLAFPQKAEAAVNYKSSASNSATSCTSGLTINKPSGVVVGDVMIMHIGGQNGSITNPSGWTQIDKGAYANGNINMATYYRVVDGTEGSSFTITASLNNSCHGVITAFTGVDTTEVIDNAGAAHSANSASSGTTITATGVTTATDNAMLVVSMLKSNAAASNNFSTISGMTESYDFGNIYNAVSMDYGVQGAAGATGNKTSTISSAFWAAHMVALKPADGAHMMLFWDGTDELGNPISLPEDWSYVIAAEGYFIRGESPENYGEAGGNASHSVTTSNVEVNPAGGSTILLGNGTWASTDHTHTASTDVAPADNNPAHRTVRLIQYDYGIPNIIPEGAIAIFDADPGIPATGWTRQSVFDDRFVKVTSTPGQNLGQDHHTHTLTWSSLSASTNNSGSAFSLFNNTPAAQAGHTHDAPSPTTTGTNGTDPCDVSPVDDQCLPPHVAVRLAKANVDTPVLSVGIIAMFDAAPGGGWVVRSDTGGPFHQRLMRGNSSYIEGLGAETHTHSDATSGQSGGVNGLTNRTAGLGITLRNHTHTVTASFNPSSSHVPPYYNVVIAEKVNFSLKEYRWFEDNNNLTVTVLNNAWSSQNIPQSAPITILPAANDAPRHNRELRLRVQIEVGNAPLAPDEIQFILQFKEASDASCTTESWTNVGNSSDPTVWRYAVSDIGDGTQLTNSAMTPTSEEFERYIKSQTPGTNINAVAVGDRMELDFHIVNNGAKEAAQYNFRVVEDSGILLSEYPVAGDGTTDNCPRLETFPGTSQQLRHGNFFNSRGSEVGFSWSD